MWHRDFPSEVREDMWDILAKALMMRAGGAVKVSAAEMRLAADTQAEVKLDEHGGVRFRVERQ